MLVDGVDVEQVVLHQPDHRAERRQVGGEHAVAVHASQFVGDALRLTQDLHEQAARTHVGAERVVDQVAVTAHQADGRRAHPLQFRVLLHQQEQLEQRERVALEHVVADRLEKAVAHLETPVQRLWRGVVVGVEDGLLEQLQQHLVEPGEFHHHPVVLLHELLDAEAPGLVVVVVELLGEGALVVEQQAVLASPGEHVQREAYLPQERLTVDQGRVLLLGQEVVVDQVVERGRGEVALRHPADHLDVTQPARALLDVRLEVVAGVVIARVAGLLLGELLLEVAAAGPDAVVTDQAAERGEQVLGLAAQQARLEQVGLDGDVARALFDALGKRAHAVSDLEADVPQEGDERFDALAVALVVVTAQQDHQVDVRAQMQFAAAVTADRDQRDVGIRRVEVAAPGAFEDPVDECRVARHQQARRCAGQERLALGLDRPAERVAEPGDRAGRGLEVAIEGGEVEDGLAGGVDGVHVRSPRRGAGSAPRSRSRSPPWCAPTGRRGCGPW